MSFVDNAEQSTKEQTPENQHGVKVRTTLFVFARDAEGLTINLG